MSSSEPAAAPRPRRASAADPRTAEFTIAAPCACVVGLAIEPYVIALRAPFGTSHSVTSARTNAQLSLTIAPVGAGPACVVRAFAEVGLPPKKPHVYASDYADCADHFGRLAGALGARLERWCGRHAAGGAPGAAAGPTFEEVAGPGLGDLFAALRGRRCGGVDAGHTGNVYGGCVDAACIALLSALGDEGVARGDEDRAPRAGWEMAAMHAWGAALGVPVADVIGLPPPPRPPRAFYTAGLDGVPAMVRSAVFGRAHTPHLKIKVDGDMARCAEIIDALAEAVLVPAAAAAAAAGSGAAAGAEAWWSVDANAAWTPELTEAFLDRVLPSVHPLARAAIRVVEQPFPVGVLHAGAAELARWREVRETCENAGLLVFADETARDEGDIRALNALDIVHGINVKLEKTGGCARGRGPCLCAREARTLRARASVLAALRALRAAAEIGDVWLGCMVGSSISMNGSAAFAGLAGYLDLDGALLIEPSSERASGGFRWGKGARVEWGGARECCSQRGGGAGAPGTAEYGTIVMPGTAGFGMTLLPRPA